MEELDELFFVPHRVLFQRDGVSSLLSGSCSQGAQRFDGVMADSLQHRLFKEENEPFGLDLFALNVQRGRDHGVCFVCLKIAKLCKEVVVKRK